MSLSPEYWGASLWKTMFSVAYVYPHRPTSYQRTAAINYYNSLSLLIPCIDCRAHYAKLLKARPVSKAVGSRGELLRWLEAISTATNEHIGKPVVDYSSMYADLEKSLTTPIPPLAPQAQKFIKPGIPLTRGTPVSVQGVKLKIPVAKKPCNCGKRNIKQSAAISK